MVWFSVDEHIFYHSWDKVVEAALRKYPNPESKNVYGTDVYERQVDENGNLHSKRLISSIWSNAYTNWLSKVVRIDLTKTLYAIEYSILDTTKKSFELYSRNYSFLDYIVVDEKLTYTPHPTILNSTLLKQEWRVTCNNLSFTSFFESAMGTTMMKNAIHGRQGIEYVINQVREELERFAPSKISREVQNITTSTIKELSSLQQSMEQFANKCDENLKEERHGFIRSANI